jgi:hypothetical protein
VNEAIRKNFELTVGDGILRAAVVVVIGVFAVLLLRESGRHFREADTTEDVALSLKALAPFFSVGQITGASAVDAVAVISSMTRTEPWGEATPICRDPGNVTGNP